MTGDSTATFVGGAHSPDKSFGLNLPRSFKRFRTVTNRCAQSGAEFNYDDPGGFV